MDLHSCPDRIVLTEYVLGTIALDELEPLAAHVQGCAHCEETVANLETSTDAVIEKLRRPAPRDSFAEEDACRRAVAAIEAIGGDSGEPASVTVPKLLPPQRLGQYQILEEIGRGGIGIVYKSLHRELEKVVALKVLRSERLQGEQALSRFKREMRSVGKLDHPHIVRATDAGEADGLHFLVMEFVDGIDIATLSREPGRLSVADACEIVRQAAMGLQEAHVHGLVHRDIKPSNLMLARTLRGSQPPLVKILDLGLALLDDRHGAAHELTETGQTMGTLDFMAPEQADDSHSVDIRADIYSLGATLYKLLTGEGPIGGECSTKLQKLTALATQSAPAITEKRDDLPHGLAVVVHRMLAKAPGRRYDTPAQVAEALQPFCAGHDLAVLLQEARVNAPVAEFARIPTGQRADGPTGILANSATKKKGGILANSAAKSGARRGRRWIALVGILLAAILGFALFALFFQTENGPPNTGTDDANRRAVAWALSVGGTVYALETNQEEIKRQVTSPDDLPSQPYTLEITFPANSQVTNDGIARLVPAMSVVRLTWFGVDDPELAELAKMRQLRHLSIHGTSDANPFGGVGITNTGMAHLAELENLESLFLASNHATDDSLAHLSGLTKLRKLQLYLTQLTDAGLAHLQGLTDLEILTVGYAKITDEGFRHFQPMRKLREIKAPYCKSITGARLAELGELPHLTHLTFYGTSFDDAGLEQLARFPHLNYLSLGRTKVTNEGLGRLLERFSKLSTLNLEDNPQLTDDLVPSLTKLGKLDTLNYLWLVNTGISVRGVVRIKAARPETQIISHYSSEVIARLAVEMDDGKNTDKRQK